MGSAGGLVGQGARQPQGGGVGVGAPGQPRLQGERSQRGRPQRGWPWPRQGWPWPQFSPLQPQWGRQRQQRERFRRERSRREWRPIWCQSRGAGTWRRHTSNSRMRRRPRSPHTPNNQPEMLRIGLLWRGLLKVELEILQNYRKIATLAFLRERQKAADMGTGNRPRLIISRHRYNKQNFCVSEVPWNALPGPADTSSPTTN